MPPPAEGFAARFVIGPALRTQPDRRLITLVREGYENAFEEIVRRYGKPLTRYAAGIVGARAEDVTQDAFSKALLALRRDGAEIELRPWLFRIVRNTALNSLRDSPPSAEALAEVIASGASPAEELERREELADLMRRLQSLPEAQRAAIVMRELEGLSHEEIASALGLSDGGARQAIYRARRSLRDGAGMLLPLPLLKALLAGAAGSPAVEATAGVAGVGGAAGAGVALKAAAATVLVAGAVGAGVAIDHNRHPHQPTPAATSSVVADDSATPVAASVGSGGPGETSGHDSPGNSGRGNGHGPAGGRGDHGHRGADPPSASGSGNDSGQGDGGSDGSGGGDRHSEPSDNSEPGSSTDGKNGSAHHSGRDSGASSGSGGDSSDDGGGSGSSGSGSSGSSGSGSGSTSSDDGLSSDSGSESGASGGSGDDGSGGGGGDDSSNSESSGDSLGGSGFSVQTQPQTQEEP
jgi:RNA polymerase sigma factor (sigma-70 family)